MACRCDQYIPMHFQRANWDMAFKNHDRQECHPHKLVIRRYEDYKQRQHITWL